MFKYLIIILLFYVNLSAQVEWTKFNSDSIKTSEKKFVLLYFTADWCTWCRQLNQTTFKDDKISSSLKNDFVAAKLNESNKYELHTYNKEFVTGKEFAAKVGIESYPTLIITDKELVQLRRIKGYINPNEFKQMLNGLYNEYNK